MTLVNNHFSPLVESFISCSIFKARLDLSLDRWQVLTSQHVVSSLTIGSWTYSCSKCRLSTSQHCWSASNLQANNLPATVSVAPWWQSHESPRIQRFPCTKASGGWHEDRGSPWRQTSTAKIHSACSTGWEGHQAFWIFFQFYDKLINTAVILPVH